MSLVVIVSLVAGLVAGSFLGNGIGPTIDGVSEIALLLLLFSIGISATKQGLLKMMIENRVKITLLVVSVLVGTLLGALLAGWISGIGIKETLLVASGFGFYSLASTIIYKQGLVQLGALTFLSNIFRELLALFLTPYSSKISPFIPGAMAGSAADTILPAIAKHNGEDAVLTSLISAIILSLMVAGLTTALLGLNF